MKIISPRKINRPVESQNFEEIAAQNLCDRVPLKCAWTFENNFIMKRMVCVSQFKKKMEIRESYLDRTPALGIYRRKPAVSGAGCVPKE